MRTQFILPHPLLLFENAQREKRGRARAMQADKKKTQAESSKCNVVTEERIWKEAVHRESTAARMWSVALRQQYYSFSCNCFVGLQGE